MTLSHNPTIKAETSGDLEKIDALEIRVFGPGRYVRTAYRVRESFESDAVFCFVAQDGDRVLASIRFTPLCVGSRDGALLLGPLIVDPEIKGRGLGLQLIERGLAAARQEGYALVLLVGDLPYYSRAGFGPVPRGRIVLPGPVDQGRLLALELKEGALQDYAGMVRG